MSATDKRVELPREPEPKPRPADPRYRWNGLYWEARFLECQLCIHFLPHRTETPYSAAVIGPGGAQFSGQNFAEPDGAANDVRSLVRDMTIYLVDRQLADIAVFGEIPF